MSESFERNTIASKSGAEVSHSKVSAIIITKNEEKNLARCLKSLQGADQIVVVDSGSTDLTLKIAQEYHAEVYVEEWKGYTEQKNSALQKINGDWVLSLDADEEFSDEAQADIRKLIQEDNPTVDGYAFRRKVFYLGKWIYHGDWYPDYVVRLWRPQNGKFKGGRVHESVEVEGKVKYLRSEIFHYTYQSIEDQKARMQKYAKLWAQDQYDKGKSFRWIDLALRPPARFFRALILKAGWMDGWRGWLIAWMCAREVCMKYKNLRELTDKPSGVGHDVPGQPKL